ncbi:hypothetical protein L6R29_26105 [Myxococcota bacterium]|nr:hypothetical protein [Myxococcota bacterium]
MGYHPTPYRLSAAPLTPCLANRSQVFQHNDSVAWTLANTGFFGQLHHTSNHTHCVEGFHPDDLYRKVGYSHEKALQASLALHRRLAR